MRRFAALFDALDRTTSTNAKVDAMAAYFRDARPEDAAWAMFFLTGARLKRLLTSRRIWEWSLTRTGLEEWLLGECYSVVGDGAETIALLVESRRAENAPDLPLSRWVEERLMLLPTLDASEQRAAVTGWWDELEGTELLLFNKMVTGELRVGVSHRLVVRAVAGFAGLDEALVAHRLSGDWRPTASAFQALIAPASDEAPPPSRPYPFFLASPLEGRAEDLGDRSEWLVEWKWDGIRAQLIKRDGQVWLWSRGDELITERFPEIRDAGARLPDGTVLDGEVMAYREGALPFAVLQKRIGRKELTRRILSQAPAAFLAYDLLEQGGQDIRERALAERRGRLVEVLMRMPGRLVLSPEVAAADWEQVAVQRSRSRHQNVEGVMIKRLSSPYQVGRKRGDWWKWKIDPYSVDAVLVYAQPGHGRRANLLTDYTFAVWDKPKGEGLFEAAASDGANAELVPFAKAYSGLTDEEIARLDRWIRQHTIERFGPVRAVEPVLVFELHFEGIATSGRHRSGVAVRFPRIARWREDKKAADADTLDRVKGLMRAAK
jgi:DNA ligase-1